MKVKSQFTKLSIGELTTKAVDLNKRIVKLRLEKFVGKSRNVREGFILRKQLALVKTLINNEQRSTAQ